MLEGNKLLYILRKGSLIPGPHRRMWVGGKQQNVVCLLYCRGILLSWATLGAHLYLQPLPTFCIATWVPPPVALDSHRSMKPTVNCAFEGSRLCALESPLSQFFWKKLSSMKPVSGAKMVRDSCPKSLGIVDSHTRWKERVKKWHPTLNLI